MLFEMAKYPKFRARRIRKSASIRRLVQECRLDITDLIWPIFVGAGKGVAEPVSLMPGVNRVSIDLAVRLVKDAAARGIQGIAIFPATDESKKSSGCEEAWNPYNLANTATRAIKDAVPDVSIMLDVALDPYNIHGHDGIVQNGKVLNDETLECLKHQALSHAEAGADILGPSDMMDGRIGVIRTVLEEHGHKDTLILSYAAKYASAFYGPFRDAVRSAGALEGDKKTYQMDTANSNEALRMVQRDLSEGADMIMVKPGLLCLDICRRIKESFGVPTFTYQVSGEYAMIVAASSVGAIERSDAVIESLVAFKRAGCDGILTYFAIEVADQIT